MLSTLPTDSSILLSPATTSVSLFKAVPPGMKIIEDFSIPGRLKAVKNKVEIANIGQAMVKDGIALTKFFFCWNKAQCRWSIQNFHLPGSLIF